MKNIVSIVSFFVLLFSNATQPLYSQWIQTSGPTGGIVYAIEGFAPNNGVTDLLAATSAGVYRTSDHGSTWVEAGTGLNGATVTCFAKMGQTLYATTSTSIWSTTDHGSSWASAMGDLSPSSSLFRIFASGTSLFGFSRDFSVYRSSDGGNSWIVTLPRIPGVLYGTAAVRGTYIFVGESGSTSEGIQRSSNNGETWEAVNSGLTDIRIRGLYVTGSKIIAWTEDGYFASTDDGENWSSITTLPAGLVALLPGLESELFALTAENVLLSKDQGLTWSPFISEKGIQRIMVAGSSIIAEKATGLSITTNRGSTWSTMNEQWIGTGYGASLSVPDGAGQRLVGAGGTLGICYSTNGGDIWKKSNLGIEGVSISAITSSTNGGITTLYLSSDSGIFRSDDLGSSWTRTALHAPTSSVTTIGETVLAGVFIDGGFASPVLRSTDKGSSWTPSGLQDNTLAVTALSSQGSIAHVGTWNETASSYYSSDAGLTWSEGDGLPGKGWTYSFLSHGTKLYAGNYGVYRSDDSGAHWTDISMESVKSQYVFGLAAVDNVMGGTNLYAATMNGVFQLLDGGSAWSQINDGLKDVSLSSVLVSGSYLYAGTSSAGIWKRPLSELGASKVAASDEADQVNVFPNPTNGLCSLTGTGHSIRRVTVSDLLGTQLLSKVNVNGIVTIDLTGFPAGLYFADIWLGNGTRVEKRIVKE